MEKMYPNINASSVQVNSINLGKIKRIALIRKMKIYQIANEAMDEYLLKEENVKMIENFDKAFYRT